MNEAHPMSAGEPVGPRSVFARFVCWLIGHRWVSHPQAWVNGRVWNVYCQRCRRETPPWEQYRRILDANL